MELGWRRDLEDFDYLRLPGRMMQALPESFDAPEAIDPRSWLSIEQQGQVGSCAGHAMSSCCEVLNWIDSGGGVIQLSRMFAYLMGQKEDGIRGDNGATISGVVKSAKRNGICREDVFPYPGRYVTEIPDAATKEAKDHKILQHESLSNYEQCFRWLATGTGVVEIGIPWKSDLADNRTGIIEQAGGQNYGGHALAIVGYTTRKDTSGRNYLIMVNSHGTGWGSNGTAEIAPRLFDDWGRDSYSEMIGVTDLEEFGSGRVDWIKNNPMV